MKKSILLLLSSMLLLSSCEGGETSSKANGALVTFNPLREGVSSLKVEVGEDKKVAPSDEITALTANYKYHTFVNWFKTEEAAKTLDAGENNENIFHFEDTVTSSLTLYAGYEVSFIDKGVTNKIELTLGAYQKLGYSPLPLLEGTPYEDLSKETYSFKAVDVEEDSLNKAGDLLTENGFVSQGNGLYLDKLGRYFVSLTYANKELKYTLSFNDEEGKLPSNALGTISSALDASLYLKDEGFTLAKNDKDQDLSKKFIVTQKRGKIVNGLVSDVKVLCYTPKEADEDAAKSFGNYLKGVGYSLASNTSLLYVDPFMSSIVSVSTVKKMTLMLDSSLKAAGAKEGMVMASFYSAYKTSLTKEELAKDYESITSVAYPDSFPDFAKIGKAYSLINGYSSGENVGPGFVVSACNKIAFDEVLNELYAQGYSYTKSTSSYYWTFTLSSPTGEHVMQFTYYDSTKIKGLMSDLCKVVIIRAKSAYEKLSEWLEKQNVGGGSLTSIPALPNKKVTGNRNSSLPYVFGFSGSDATAEDVTTYGESLVKAGFVKGEVKDGYHYYHTKDGFYDIAVYFDEAHTTLYVFLYYNCYSSTSRNVSAILKEAQIRLGVENIAIPGLSEWLGEGEQELTTMSVFDGTYQRYLIYGLNTTEENATAQKTALLAKLDEDTTHWKKVGTNSSGTVFYQNSDGVTVYVQIGKQTKDDGTKVHYLYLGMYK